MLEAASPIHYGVVGDKGLGVLTRAPLAAGTVVLRDPVVLVHEDDVTYGAPIESHLISWDAHYDVIAFGLTSLLNHSEQPNCRVEPDYQARELCLVMLRDVAAGEELTIRYRCELWFEPAP